MSNQLFNSMVRGFGMTLGRKAANRLTRPSQTRVVNDEPTFSKKQLELIENFENIKQRGLTILSDADDSYHKGDLTLTEYQIIQLQVNEQLADADKEIEKIKSVKQSKGSIWTVVGVIAAIYGLIWFIKALNSL